MSRLDQHVGRVQNKLAVGVFLSALGVTIAGLFTLLVLGVAVERLTRIGVPKPAVWVWAGLGVAIVAAGVYAVLRRPSRHQAAIAIDRKLGLAEKFSTALYVRHASDPFAAAAVLDAERTADNVTLHRQFPMAFPMTAWWAGGTGVVLVLALWLLPELDLFGREARNQALAAKAREQTANRHVVEVALAKVASLPKSVQNAPEVQLAKAEAQHALDQGTIDPTQAADNAQKLLQEASQAGMEEVKQNQQFAQAQTNEQLFKTLNPSADDKGPIADASRDMAKGNFAGAMEKMESLPQKFNDMSKADQQKAAEQMSHMANTLAKMASDPSAMKQLQQQIQQMGASQQQAQQLAQTVQQATQGNPQAQQQLQQMQKQLMQQMNGGKGPTQAQQQQIQQAVKQMQAAANTQQTAQQMSAAAQQMASAMQQAAQAQAGQRMAGQQPGQQQASAKQGGQQQSAQQQSGQQQAGQKPGGQQQANGQKQAGGQQQANGQKPGGAQPGGQQQASGQQQGGQPQSGGQKPGGAAGQQGQGQQGMANAQQQMQDALAQMDAVQKDAQQMAAAQNADDGSGQNPGPGPGNDPGDQSGPNGQGGPKKHGPGNGGGTGGAGGPKADLAVAAFSVKQEMDPSQRIDNGRMLAKTFVKAPTDKGTSTIQLTPAAAAAVKDATDDVPEESVPKDAQRIVKDYFNTIDNGR
jgi:hypothetical protein